ncbi:MAG: DUF2911 domain-containing protein [Bacteroidetes bacterium]|jgi:hypothetical protein|nr:DUF2911 domain-containing protein [Bacteroidota bacterium]MDF1868662.1 DUF2911 domain-containing protein [Saprospiraceae bacterium]
MKISKLFFLSFLSILFIGISTQANAQEDKSKRPSPPAVATATSGDLTITLDYSSPAVKGRKVLGKLVPDGKIWRLGANEATTFEVNQDVMIEGQRLPAGKYALFSIQDGGDWTFIFNSEADQWGAYNYNKSKDVLRIDASPSRSEDMRERMAFEVTETTRGAADVVFNWEYIKVKFNVKAAR